MSQKPSEEILNKIKIIADKLKEWKTNKADVAILREELPGVSDKLNELLPELDYPFLFAIDGILYSDQDLPDKKGSKDLDDSKKLFRIIDTEIYLFAYYISVKSGDGFHNIQCDRAFLKVVKHMPIGSLFINQLLDFLLDGRIVKDVCRGLKLLKIAMATNHSKDYKHLELCSLMSRFKNIPTNHKDKKKENIALFIHSLATECYELFEEEYKFPKCLNQEYQISVPVKGQIFESVHSMLYREDISNTHLDYFYELFTSKNDEKRKKYYKYFLRAVASCPEEDFNSGFLILINSLLYKVVSIKSDKVDKKMRVIDGRFYHNIESCLDIGVVDINLNQLSNELKANEETDFEKFFIYDDVMKCLHLLTRFYDAYNMRHSLCAHEFIGAKLIENISNPFEKDNKLMHYLGFYLNNPKLLVPWYIEKTLQMCPFLIFPHHEWPLVIDLIQFLRDETFSVEEKVCQKIDELKAINSTTTLVWQMDKSRFPLKSGNVISPGIASK